MLDRNEWSLLNNDRRFKPFLAIVGTFEKYRNVINVDNWINVI